jgi:hypothetical protein
MSAAAVLRLHAARRVGPQVGSDLLAEARRLAGDPAGVRCEPPYPGATAGVESLGRLVFGCVVHRHGAVVGVCFTTLIPGRAPLVSLAPPSATVPDHWRPLPCDD